MVQEVKMMRVDAKRAHALLAKSSNVRKISKGTVERYFEDMKEGRWAPNSVLHFDERGQLLDGFHRLTALARWGGTLDFVAVCGENPADVEVIDTGRGRTMADLLRQRGEQDYAQLAAVVRLCMDWDRAQLDNGPAGGTSFTRRATLDWLDANPDVRDAVPDARTLYRTCGMQVGPAGAFVFRARRAWAERVDGFVAAVCFGKGDDLTQGAIALQRSLRARAADLRQTNRRTYLALAVKGWNYHLTGRDVERVVWNVRRNEPFPRMLTKADVTKGRKLQWEDDDA